MKRKKRFAFYRKPPYLNDEALIFIVAAFDSIEISQSLILSPRFCLFHPTLGYCFEAQKE